MQIERTLSRRKLGWIASLSIPICIAPLWASMQIERVGMLSSALGFQLLFFLAITTITDLSSRKIYNISTFSALAIALAVNTLASSSHLSAQWLGAVGLSSSLTGAAACFFVVFLAYQLTGCGAGDVKMATVLGAILGLRLGLSAIVYSYIAAAAISLIAVAYSVGLGRVARTFALAGAGVIIPSCRARISESDRSLLTSTIPMAPFFCFGTLLAVWERIA